MRDGYLEGCLHDLDWIWVVRGTDSETVVGECCVAGESSGVLVAVV